MKHGSKGVSANADCPRGRVLGRVSEGALFTGSDGDGMESPAYIDCKSPSSLHNEQRRSIGILAKV